jgi:1,4-alpha-glucan branching enzyme
MTKKIDKRCRLTFLLDAPGAKEVIVVGDFNKWNNKVPSMKKDKKGIWGKIVMLLPGRHEYKFLVDGEWRHDPKNDQTCYNQHGTLNSVITVN